MRRLRLPLAVLLLLVLVLAGGCCSMTPMETVPYVDLGRFSGDWYVIANIPTSIEKGAHNAVESYAPPVEGVVATTFTFRKGGFDGPEKVYRPRGYVRDDGTNAVWGMQFIWPFKADYRVIWLDDAYTMTVIGRTKRDHVWIMARTPTIADEDYERLLAFVAERGYDPAQVVRVPQRWEN